jgi:transposase
LLRKLLLQTLFTIRSERQLTEQTSYNMLFRWFVGPAMDVPAWDVTVFTKNRDARRYRLRFSGGDFC